MAVIELQLGNDKERTASLDRIDSTKGYTKDNIQWIYKPLNLMKYKYSEDKFIKLCILVADYRGKNENIM